MRDEIDIVFPLEFPESKCKYLCISLHLATLNIHGNSLAFSTGASEDYTTRKPGQWESPRR